MSTEEDLRRAEQLGRLTSTVEHIQADVTDIKERLFGVEGKIDTVKESLEGKIDTVKESLEGKIDAFKESLEGKIDAVKDSLSSAKVWALTLYVALAGSMLFVMAKGFKWI